MKTIVLGAGMTGLAAAMMLARDGHRVTVLERDPDPVPDTPEAAWERWRRRGVAQFRQAHLMQARGTQVLEHELPDVRQALEAAGALRLDVVSRLPVTIADRSPRPGDERLLTVTARRSTLEQVIARAAESEPGVEVRRGAPVAWLEMRDARVTAVRDARGDRHEGDLVVDAMGRGSVLPRLLGDAVQEEQEAGGFLYYTRFFRGRMPELRALPLTHMGRFSIVALPADAGVWSITLVISARDRELRRLRDEAAWTAMVRSCPQHAHWLDGAPLTGVVSMGGRLGRRRTIEPRLGGIVSLGDAWAYTNPSLGRGMTLGLMHAALLRRVGGDPAAFAAATEREIGPWYRSTVATDRARLAQIDVLLAGSEPAPPADLPGRVLAALPVAMLHDPDVFRAGSEISNCLTLPQDVLSRPGLAQRVLAAAGEVPALAA